MTVVQAQNYVCKPFFRLNFLDNKDLVVQMKNKVRKSTSDIVRAVGGIILSGLDE
jgi:hypothetical protein